MELVNLDSTTPYNQVITQAVEAIKHSDFEFNVDPSGTVEGLVIFDDAGDALNIEMDDVMFFEVYDIVMASDVLTSESKSIVESVAALIATAA